MNQINNLISKGYSLKFSSVSNRINILVRRPRELRQQQRNILQQIALKQRENKRIMLNELKEKLNFPLITNRINELLFIGDIEKVISINKSIKMKFAKIHKKVIRKGEIIEKFNRIVENVKNKNMKRNEEILLDNENKKNSFKIDSLIFPKLNLIVMNMRTQQKTFKENTKK